MRAVFVQPPGIGYAYASSVCNLPHFMLLSMACHLLSSVRAIGLSMAHRLHARLARRLLRSQVCRVECTDADV